MLKVLYISLAQNHTYVRTFQKATISLPILHQLELSGASQAKIDGFSSSDKAAFKLSGASNLSIEYFKAGDTTFEISTASNVAGNIDMSNAMLKLVAASTAELTGTATNILIEGAGLSNARLSELKAVDVDVSLVGTSRASVNASGRLDAHLSNASVSLCWKSNYGNIKTSGGSSISQK